MYEITYECLFCPNAVKVFSDTYFSFARTDDKCKHLATLWAHKNCFLKFLIFDYDYYNIVQHRADPATTFNKFELMCEYCEEEMSVDEKTSYMKSATLIKHYPNVNDRCPSDVVVFHNECLDIATEKIRFV